MSDPDFWAWVEPDGQAETRGIFASSTRRSAGDGLGTTFVTFSTWNNAAATIGAAAVGGQSITFDKSPATQQNGGVRGTWGFGKKDYAYIRDTGTNNILARVDSSDDTLANWTTSDVLDLTAAGYDIISESTNGFPKFIPPFGEYIGLMVTVGTVRTFLTIDKSTGAVVDTLVGDDLTSGPWTVELNHVQFSPDGSKAAFYVEIEAASNRIFIYDRTTSTWIGNLATTISAIGTNSPWEMQWDDDGTILWWNVGGNLAYVTDADWNTINIQPESGVDIDGFARFWDFPTLSRDKTRWMNAWRFTMGAPLTYHNHLHYMDASFTHISEIKVTTIGSNTFVGDFDETGLWWFGGDFNINGSGFARGRDPFADPSGWSIGGSRGQPYLMRPFRPY